MPATAIPTRAITDARLEASALRVLAYLCEYWRDNPIMETIADALQISKKTVVRATLHLQLEGYITIEKEQSKPNHYRILFEQIEGDTGKPTEGHRETEKGTQGNREGDTGKPRSHETTDVSNIYNTSICSLQQSKSYKENTEDTAAVLTLGTLVTLPTDIQNPELVNRAKEFIQHTSLDNYLSAIRGWQAMYSPVLKDVLEDVVLKGQSLSPVWVKRRLVAKMSELLSKPDPDAKALDLAQRREYELRIKQVEEMRREGVSEAEIKEYLTNCQKNYPLKDTSLRERTEWAAICGA